MRALTIRIFATNAGPYGDHLHLVVGQILPRALSQQNLASRERVGSLDRREEDFTAGGIQKVPRMALSGIRNSLPIMTPASRLARTICSGFTSRTSGPQATT